MTTFERLKQVNDRIDVLKQILNRGEYKAAGIKLDLYIGNREYPDLPNISLDVYSLKEEEILNTILQGLEQTSGYLKKHLEREVQEIQDYLGVT